METCYPEQPFSPEGLLSYLSLKMMTITQQACEEVPGFDVFYQNFLRRIVINDMSESARHNYGRNLARIALYYKKVPISLQQEEIEDYLYYLKQNGEFNSDNTFKFTIASLRFVFRMEGMDELRLKLPSIRSRKKLPVVLSREEVTAMMQIPFLLKHRVMIALLYGCGLRCAEVRNLLVSDIDLGRNVLLVRQGKGRKDRYVPLGKILPGILQEYIRLEKPVSWLFPGHRSKKSGKFSSVFDPKFGQRSVQWAIKRAAQLARINKNISVHSLRHTYATHLLEDGVNILSIKELLGHVYLKTTLLYLHVAEIRVQYKCSPLDLLPSLRVIGYIQGEFNF